MLTVGCEMNTTVAIEKKSLFDRVLDIVERVGNRMPTPVSMFCILIIILMIISHLMSGIAVINPADGKEVIVESLFSRGNLTKLLTQMVFKFQSFPPLGMVLFVMLGAGVAAKTDLLDMAMRRGVTKFPTRYITFAITFIALLADGAGDSGIIILPPLAAIIFLSIGRNPLIGMFLAYACVPGGFSADLVVNMTDVLFASFTLPAARLIDPNYTATPAMNYYIVLACMFTITVSTVFVTEKIVAPRLDKISYIAPGHEQANGKKTDDITDAQKKGLKWAGISVLLMVVLMVALCIGGKAFMRDPATGSLVAYESPLMQGMIPIITVMFLVPGILYGIATGKIKSDKDVVRLMAESMSDMGGYLVIALVSALFIAMFAWSNIGVATAVLGAEWIKSKGLGGMEIIIALIFFCAFLNIFIGSASAKWAMLAPVFVPMFMLLGYDPSLTQMAFRIGAIASTPITPLVVFFPMLLAFAKQYNPDIGMGTIIANMIPYSLSFLVVYTATLITFIVLNIPLGPGSPIYYVLPGH